MPNAHTHIYIYIFLPYAPIMFVMYYLANWIWRWTMLVEKGRKKPSLSCEKRIAKTQELWTNKWCYNALCIELLMIYGIINLFGSISWLIWLYFHDLFRPLFITCLVLFSWLIWSFYSLLVWSYFHDLIGPIFMT